MIDDNIDNKAFKILVDWGGTISRDGDLFACVSIKSGANNYEFTGPECWEKVRSLGNNNAFDKMPRDFMFTGECYSGAIETITKFDKAGEENPATQTFIVYDNKPDLRSRPDVIVSQMASNFNKKGGCASGFYCDANKLQLAKIIRADLVIDDDPRICLALASAGIKTILMMRKWNRLFDEKIVKLYVPEHKRDIITSNIFVVEDWYEASQTIEGLVDLNNKKG